MSWPQSLRRELVEVESQCAGQGWLEELLGVVVVPEWVLIPDLAPRMHWQVLASSLAVIFFLVAVEIQVEGIAFLEWSALLYQVQKAFPWSGKAESRLLLAQLVCLTAEALLSRAAPRTLVAHNKKSKKLQTRAEWVNMMGNEWMAQNWAEECGSLC